jgi:hypothetical protein
MDLISGISSANNALTLLGKISALVKKGASIELQEAILGLRQSVLSLKEENLNLQEANTSLQKTIQKRETFKFEDPVYYQLQANGSKDGPFCQVCEDSQSKQVRLQTIGVEQWHCLVCSNKFSTERGKEHQRADTKKVNDDRRRRIIEISAS